MRGIEGFGHDDDDDDDSRDDRLTAGASLAIVNNSQIKIKCRAIRIDLNFFMFSKFIYSSFAQRLLSFNADANHSN